MELSCPLGIRALSRDTGFVPQALGRGSCGKNLLIKRARMLVENFGKKPKEGPRACLVGVAFSFSPLKGNNFYITHYHLAFRLNILTGTTRAPATKLLMLNTLTGTKTAYF